MSSSVRLSLKRRGVESGAKNYSRLQRLVGRDPIVGRDWTRMYRYCLYVRSNGCVRMTSLETSSAKLYAQGDYSDYSGRIVMILKILRLLLNKHAK